MRRGVSEVGRAGEGGRKGKYQSIDWGGSSFALEVLTVSTQPGDE